MAKKEVVAFGPFKDFIADGVRAGDVARANQACVVAHA